MNKFSVIEYPEVKNDANPVLYKVNFANRYYIHKGKKLRDSVDRFLDDVDRGMRGKSCPSDYVHVVEYCKKHPQVYKVSIEVILNDVPAKLLRAEDRLFKGFKSDQETLNDKEAKSYRPEWMLKEIYQERCDPCISSGVVGGKKMKFRFCPNCGHVIK